MASSPSIAPSTPISSPSPRYNSPHPSPATNETFIARFIITPLTFLSFILSLSLIDYRNTSTRIRSHAHTTPHTHQNELLNRLHGWVYREVSQPYAYVRSPGPEKRVLGEETEKKDEAWYWHTNQRKMMKMEVGQAFEMRESVLMVMLAGGLLMGSGLVWGLNWAWGWLAW